MDGVNDQALHEMRLLNSKFDDLALQIRIDTPWQRVRDNIHYGLNLIREIPLGARLVWFSGIALITLATVIQMTNDMRKKLLMFGIDLISLGIVLIWT